MLNCLHSCQLFLQSLERRNGCKLKIARHRSRRTVAHAKQGHWLLQHSWIATAPVPSPLPPRSRAQLPVDNCLVSGARWRWGTAQRPGDGRRSVCAHGPSCRRPCPERPRPPSLKPKNARLSPTHAPPGQAMDRRRSPGNILPRGQMLSVCSPPVPAAQCSGSRQRRAPACSGRRPAM